MKYDEFLGKIPKIELHCHLEGTVHAATFVKLAARYGLSLPVYQKPEDLYTWITLPEFLKIYQQVGHSIRERDEFRMVTYEALQEASACSVRYQEMFWSPIDHLNIGVPYTTALDGIIEGIRDAKIDFGINCRLITSINREMPAELGTQVVRLAIDHPREELIGIGLEYDETNHPPQKFIEAYRLAQNAGLHRTAHACEKGGPPVNLQTCLDLLHCERIDHGYRVLEDDAIAQRCVDEGIVFTCAPLAYKAGIIEKHGSWDLSKHPLVDLNARGIRITLNTDDPGMVRANLTDMFGIASRHMGFGPQDLKRFVMNSIDGSWIDEGKKLEWRKEWGKEIDDLITCLENNQN